MKCEDCIHFVVCIEVDSLKCRKDFVWYRAEDGGCPYFKSKFDNAEVKHGEWIKREPNPEFIDELHKMGIAKAMRRNSIHWTCSECGHWGVITYRFCPGCGARMEGKQVTE